VPRPGAETISSRPPKAPARFRMLTMPFPSNRPAGSTPRPSSVMVSRSSRPERTSSTLADGSSRTSRRPGWASCSWRRRRCPTARCECDRPRVGLGHADRRSRGRLAPPASRLAGLLVLWPACSRKAPTSRALRRSGRAQSRDARPPCGYGRQASAWRDRGPLCGRSGHWRDEWHPGCVPARPGTAAGRAR
jgi:hypothetical protein